MQRSHMKRTTSYYAVISRGKWLARCAIVALSAALAMSHAAADAQPRTAAEIKAARMAAYDKNGDGTIERNEVDEAVWVRFSLLDRNGDGVLAGAELDRLGRSRNVQRPRMGTVPPTFAKHTFTGSSGHSIEYGLLTPRVADSAARHPLVLCLHGRGGDSATARVVGSAEMQSKHACFVMAPICDSSQSVWVDQGFFDPIERRVLAAELLEGLEHVIAAHAIDPERIYVTGLSMGGSGTWGLIIRAPDRFAAAAPICGNVDPADAPAIASLPIWVFHGDQDATVPVESSRRMVKALKEAGGSPRYTEFAGVGHNSWDKAYAMDELWDWMFAQRKSR